ncbi:MAG: VCBS repeat-containing protein, partial [Bacteroidales bacterium]|nr:VCBS repeat-containing protein [Bacteroidales bacterium]
SQDYTDIASAISDLHANGIDSPVVFNIIPGTYTVHVTMNQIVGASETNNITFQSSTQDSSAVILQYEAAGLDDNWIFLLDGPDYLNFNHLTFKTRGESVYGTIFMFDGFSSHVSFNNNAFLGKYSGGGATARETIISAIVSYPAEQSFSNLHFTNNYFYRGSYALHLQGPNTTYQSGVVVNNNIFEETGYCCTYCNFCYAPQINNNTMEAISYGIRVNGDYGGGNYSFNKIYSDNWGMSIQRMGTGGVRALISNNFVTIGENGNYGITIVNSVYTDVLNNSVNVLSKSWDAAAFYSGYGVNTTPTVTVKNNNFSCEYSPYVLEVITENVIGEMSNNNFYTAGNYIATWAYTKVFDIKELQDLTGMNANSLSVYPHFVSDRDLHTTAPWLNNQGAYLALVSEDIDGESRSMAPDIGADEFTPDPAFTTPLDGSQEYTIGAGGTYTDFESAMADALLRGVSASVTFGFLDGTFNGPFIIKSIPGSNDNNRINIQSASTNSERAELAYTAVGNDDNFVFRFHGADFISLKNLKLSAKDDYYAQVIDLYQGADSVVIENNIITTVSNTNAVVRISHIFSKDSDFRSRIIRNNQFDGAAYSIYMRRDQNNFLYPTGAVIEGNSFTNVGYSAMYLQFYNSPKIIGNSIASRIYGIQALSCSKDLRIQKNKIDMVNGDGIYMSVCEGTEEHKGLISNNFIHCGGTSAVDGISINNSPNQLIFNNSINISNTNIGSRPLYISSGTNTSVSLYNNIFSNKGGGLAMYIYYPSTVLTCDYNAYYSIHDYLAYWGQNVTDLAALQTLNSMDEHSVFGNPHFVSDTDLHTNEEILDGAAQSFAAVPDDIDGDLRDLVTPDIGADEFGSTNLDEFVLLESELEGLSHGSIKWGDYDNDGDLDLLQTGWTGTLFEFKTKIINNTEEGFVDSGIALVGLSAGTSSSASWFDFDNDNDLDVIITGRLDGNALIKKTLIYENNSGAFIFRDDLDIQNISSSSVASVDMNHDGKYDLLILGSGESGNLSSLYLNDGSSFTEASIGLMASYEGEIYPLDIDDDGDMDIFMCGVGIDPSLIYINQDGVFTSTATEIPGVVNSSVDWADIDEDGDLDVAIMGVHNEEIILQIYLNNGMEKSEWFSLLGSYTGMESGDLSFVDYDNDGDMDLSVTGNRTGFQTSTE